MHFGVLFPPTVFRGTLSHSLKGFGPTHCQSIWEGAASQTSQCHPRPCSAARISKQSTAQLQANNTKKGREWCHPTVISWRKAELFRSKGKSVSASLHNEPLMISAGEIPIRNGWKRGIPTWEHVGEAEDFSRCALWLN